MRIEHNGLVGIGTATPAGILDIECDQNALTRVYIDNNTAGTAAGAGLLVESDSATIAVTSLSSSYTTSNQYTANAGLLESSGAGGLNISTTGAYPIRFYQNSAEVAQFDASGDLGIGTAAPTVGLDVVGYGKFHGGGGYATPTVALCGAAGAGIEFELTGTGANTWFLGMENNDAAMYLKDGSTDVMSWSLTMLHIMCNSTIWGNLGIGTDTASGYLHVFSGESSGVAPNAAADELILEGSGDTGMTILSGASSSASIFFADTGSALDGYIQYYQHDQSMTFGTAAGTRMKIVSSGNVGIGTATPDGNLHVMSSSAGSVTAHANACTGVFEASDYAGISIIGASESSIHFADAGSNIVSRIHYDHAGNNLAIDTNSVEAMRITSAGNVGIGTTTPNEGGFGAGVQVLSVVGTAAADFGAIEMTSTCAGTAGRLGDLRFINLNGTGSFVAQAGIRAIADGAVDSTAMSFFTEVTGGDFTEKMRITSAGNVGIGTATSDGLLHVFSGSAGSVSADAGGNELVLENSDHVGMSFLSPADKSAYIFFGDPGCDEVGMITYGHASNNLDFYVNDAHAMRIDNAGCVGIGLTSPANKLHVEIDTTAGSINTMPVMRLKNAKGSGNYITMHFGGGASDAFIGFLDHTTAANRLLSFAPDGGTVGMTLKSGGCLDVVGVLSKGSGSFKIDHPVASKCNTHDLVHSFIEGPQADLIYSGIIQLSGGTAIVNVDTESEMTDGTFVALNRCARVFTSNESNWDMVRGNITGNALTIESNVETSNACISWMVVGERCDQHMIDTGWTDDDGKVIVEPAKDVVE